MKRFNVVTKRTFVGNDGTERSQRNTVGTLVVFPAKEDREEGYALELFMQPETKFYVFEQKDRGEKTTKLKPEPTDTTEKDAEEIAF